MYHKLNETKLILRFFRVTKKQKLIGSFTIIDSLTLTKLLVKLGKTTAFKRNFHLQLTISQLFRKGNIRNSKLTFYSNKTVLCG